MDACDQGGSSTGSSGQVRPAGTPTGLATNDYFWTDFLLRPGKIILWC